MMLQNIRKKLRLPSVSDRGMTLIEIMIVLTIMAAVMAGVMVSIQSGKKKANINRTKMSASTVLNAVTMERIGDPKAQPSIDALGLADSQIADAWGNNFKLQYSGQTVKVVSGGPDGSVGGDDDIVVTNGSKE